MPALLNNRQGATAVIDVFLHQRALALKPSVERLRAIQGTGAVLSLGRESIVLMSPFYAS